MSLLRSNRMTIEPTLPPDRIRPRSGAPQTAATVPPAAAANPGMRTWIDATGKFKMEARFVAFQAGVVTLIKADGGELKMPLDRLSADDQAYVKSVTANP